jgi:ornithine carbamoyltransferase
VLSASFLDSPQPLAAHTLGHRRLWSPDALSRLELFALLDIARRLDRAALAAAPCRALRGKNIVRLLAPGVDGGADFDRAAMALGAQVTHLRRPETGLGEAEDARRTARLLGRLYDAIDAGGLPAPQLLELEREAGVPVLNGLADAAHPLRLLSTLVELQRLCGGALAGSAVAFEGDPLAPRGRALCRLALLAGVALQPSEAARYIADEGGAVREAGARVQPRRSDEALRLALQALLVSAVV